MTVNSLIKKLEQKVSGTKAAVQLSWADSYTIIAGLKELLSLKEQVAALESKEVCNAPHEDAVIEGCPYCEIEHMQTVIDRTARLRLELEVENQRLTADNKQLRAVADAANESFRDAIEAIKGEGK